jgi:hypothetical protein
LAYESHDGRILTWSLEAHLVDHCNLRCVQCCQLAPFFPERDLDLAMLEADLKRLRPVLRPQIFKLTGGEPLLHPDVVGALEVVRRSGIAQRVQVTTNGLLLPGMPDAFFDAVDLLKVSAYSSAPLPAKTIDVIRARCERHRVELDLRTYHTFQQITPEPPFHDPSAASKAFAGCWLKVRCHLVSRGRFYTCSRPPRLEPYLRQLGHELPLMQEDGLSIDGPDLGSRLYRYLNREDPLQSCNHCLGTTGAWRAHAQLPLRARRELPLVDGPGG